jgi:hypothetical protein
VLKAGASAVTLLGLAQPIARAEEKVDVPSFMIVHAEMLGRRNLLTRRETG